MRDEDYTYAVARVRCNELYLLNNQDIAQLVATDSYAACMKLLQDKGWGDGKETQMETLLSYETKRTWDFIGELTSDLSPFQILLLPMEYNNLKATIKSVIQETTSGNVFFQGGETSPETMRTAIAEKDYDLLPKHMRDAAKSAYETFIQTQDGQLCDAIIDSACLYAILQNGENSKNPILKEYAELTVAISDIKIAVRCCKTHRAFTFIRTSIVPCKSLDADRLTQAAAKDLSAIFEYLAATDYAEAAAALQVSYSAFESWCDNQMMSLIQAQKSNPFSVGPLFAYVVARQNEIGMVRIILSAKRGGIDDEIIRERLRDMYV